MLKLVKSFIKDESGLETVEYALLLALIVVGAIAGYQLLGENASDTANTVAGKIAVTP